MLAGKNMIDDDDRYLALITGISRGLMFAASTQKCDRPLLGGGSFREKGTPTPVGWGGGAGVGAGAGHPAFSEVARGVR